MRNLASAFELHNVCDLYELASSSDTYELKESALHFIMEHWDHISGICTSDEVIHLRKDLFG